MTQPRILDLRTVLNVWGHSVEILSGNKVVVYGYRLREGDYIVGGSGKSMAVVTATRTPMDPGDQTFADFRDLSPEERTAVLAQSLPVIPPNLLV